jgi:hypothetical protein
MIKLSNLSAVALTIFLSLGLTGCKKGPALEELKKVEAACEAKERDKAIEIAIAAADSNSAFKKAFDDVFKSVDDKKKANVCGAINLVELKSRIENGPAI